MLQRTTHKPPLGEWLVRVVEVTPSSSLFAEIDSLATAVVNPSFSALVCSLERGGSNDISRVVCYGVCYLI